jgi:chromosome segregation ATPase
MRPSDVIGAIKRLEAQLQEASDEIDTLAERIERLERAILTAEVRRRTSIVPPPFPKVLHELGLSEPS